MVNFGVLSGMVAFAFGVGLGIWIGSVRGGLVGSIVGAVCGVVVSIVVCWVGSLTKLMFLDVLDSSRRKLRKTQRGRKS